MSQQKCLKSAPKISFYEFKKENYKIKKMYHKNAENPRLKFPFMNL